MAEYIMNKTDLTNLLVETHHLIRTHGFDDGVQVEGKVPLRLTEAFKIALDESPNSRLILLPGYKRDLISAAWSLLEARIIEFYPPYDNLHDWLLDMGSTNRILFLIENALRDYGVTP